MTVMLLVEPCPSLPIYSKFFSPTEQYRGGEGCFNYLRRLRNSLVLSLHHHKIGFTQIWTHAFTKYIYHQEPYIISCKLKSNQTHSVYHFTDFMLKNYDLAEHQLWKETNKRFPDTHISWHNFPTYKQALYRLVEGGVPVNVFVKSDLFFGDTFHKSESTLFICSLNKSLKKIIQPSNH